MQNKGGLHMEEQFIVHRFMWEDAAMNVHRSAPVNIPVWSKNYGFKHKTSTLQDVNGVVFQCEALQNRHRFLGHVKSWYNTYFIMAKPLDYENLNENIKKCQYAVRGELYLRASELQKEGKKIIFTNVGYPHALGQKPLTFPRQREEHGKDPTMVDTFIITHMRKDGTYVHEKSKRIAADVESRISATKEAGEEADVTKIFVGAVDGLKKQCLYGTGSLKHKYVDLCSTSSSLATSHVESAALRTQVEQLTQQLVLCVYMRLRGSQLARFDENTTRTREAQPLIDAPSTGPFCSIDGQADFGHFG
ncbi:glutamate--glyoxylate aminotransferase 2 [Phtheirospermum japonicum]|uniref:Glutamate--glyoxylate aminotransferase 2 n=1 Tax=Phtheirospermum japonicum TaxID=374723 RepID=A0A830BL41_9LAMI|nr:glutamate--glyoxylate aminotransferase 2 [Phtheirospermum japonicum]